MFKMKFIISATVFIFFLIVTSTIKNKTRIIEKNILNLNKKFKNYIDLEFINV